LNIPVPCPNCGGKMEIITYDTTLRILKDRQWHSCKDCSFEQSVDDFKNELITI